MKTLQVIKTIDLLKSCYNQLLKKGYKIKIKSMK
jgi:hypothetical protein